MLKNNYQELFLLLNHKRKKEMPLDWISYFKKAKLTRKVLYQYLAKAPEILISNILDDKALITETSVKEVNKIENTVAKRGFIFDNILQKMLDKKLVKTCVSKEKLVDILEKVYWLHKQRNEINHANKSQAAASNQQLEQCMLETMDAIEGVR